MMKMMGSCLILQVMLCLVHGLRSVEGVIRGGLQLLLELVMLLVDDTLLLLIVI